MLEVKQLNKIYSSSNGSSQHVLKDIHLAIKDGEFVSVMGPSGSGKSTLLYTISGMDKITSGSVRFGTKEISTLSEEQLSKLRLHSMGFIFQQSSLLRNLNIFDNIILSAYVAKIDSRQSINKRAKELMKRMGIAKLSNHDITEASGGQLQRVAICRALINNPTIVFGDEPTGALNSKAANDVMDILTTINQAGTTIMLVTHDVKVAARTERVLFMLDGEIVAETYLGKTEKTKHDMKTRENKLSKWLSQMGF
jgi:putative ABC transport system ATP-binding protein